MKDNKASMVKIFCLVVVVLLWYPWSVVLADQRCSDLFVSFLDQNFTYILSSTAQTRSQSEYEYREFYPEEHIVVKSSFDKNQTRSFERIGLEDLSSVEDKRKVLSYFSIYARKLVSDKLIVQLSESNLDNKISLIFKILEGYRSFMNGLDQDQKKDYIQTLYQRPSPVDIRVNTVRDPSIRSIDIDSERLVEFKQDLKARLSQLIEGSLPANLADLIRQNLEVYLSYSTTPQAIFAGLSSFLNFSEKTQLFTESLKLSDKIRWIQNNLDDYFPALFKVDRFSFDPSLTHKQNVVRFLTSIDNLSYLLSFYILSREIKSIRHFSASFITHHILETSSFFDFDEERFLASLNKKDLIIPTLDELIRMRRKLGIVLGLDPKLQVSYQSRLVELQSAVSNLLESYTSKNVISSRKQVDLTIKEVPTSVAFLRGEIGGDCSTKWSSLFSVDPYERIFFIYDTKSMEPIGYLSSTEVIYDQNEQTKKMLYINTIAGAHLSSFMTQVIIDTMYALKDVLGVDCIGLPEHKTLNKILDYSQVHHGYLKKIVETDTEANISIRRLARHITSKPVNIRYQGQFRELIERQQDLSVLFTLPPYRYDFRSYNKKAYIYHFHRGKENLVDYHISVSNSDY